MGLGRPTAILLEGRVGLRDASTLGEGSRLAFDELDQVIAQGLDAERGWTEDVEETLDLLGPGDGGLKLGGRRVRIVPGRPQPGEKRVPGTACLHVPGDLDEPDEIRPDILRQHPLGIGLNLRSDLLELSAFHQEVRGLRGRPFRLGGWQDPGRRCRPVPADRRPSNVSSVPGSARVQ